ncbi:hypothetical protein TEA_018730 [Camellia sinensis var. sinensis]|uniref:Enoyl reductase (ER) domain-containing protein n=1 Tax=Camellia sinensis var. sinensis TaxID=542762 RepID=A0A4S4EM75_CAMSN|nr:hypothetical protein TEA_018730 [Camellia sinensis var. sinensis]
MARKLMNAVQYDSFGGGVASLKHVEIPVPALKKGEILIKMEAASLNPVDLKIQKGLMRPILIPRKLPFTPATDIAGEVVEVGTGVTKFKAGDKVVSYLGLSILLLVGHRVFWLACFPLKTLCLPEENYTSSGGGLAEFAVANETMTVPRPPEVSAAEAAGLPIAAITAHVALTQPAGVKPDGTDPKKNILITAASGGVGHYAVQLAKLGNTHVTATCGARNLDFVKSLGADEVIDYKTPEGQVLKSPSGKKYDVVVHCAGGFPWSTFEPILSTNGKVIDLTPSPSTMMTFALKKLTFSKKQLVPLICVPTVENLEYVVKLVKEGKLKTVIDSKYPVSRAEEAWAKIMDVFLACFSRWVNGAWMLPGVLLALLMVGDHLCRGPVEVATCTCTHSQLPRFLARFPQLGTDVLQLGIIMPYLGLL